MDGDPRNAAPTAYRGDGAMPVQRSRSLRRLLPGKHGVTASTTSSPTSMYPTTPRFPTNPRSQQYPPTREQRAMEQNSRAQRSASSDSYHSNKGPPPQFRNKRPMPSEAARLRSLNTGQQSPTYPDPRYRQEAALQQENFSRPRKASIKKGEEPFQTIPSSSSSIPQQPRGGANGYSARPEYGRERGFSEAPASMSTGFAPSRPLRNSFSIPELSAAEWQQNISNNPANARNGLRFRDNSPNPDLRPSFPGAGNGEEVRESLRSIQTTGTAGTGTTWKTGTTSTTWGTNASSSFLDTERSSIMSKSSSARSVNGRDQIDDFLDMYDGGFGESGTEDEPNANRPSTSRSVQSENGTQTTTPEFDPTTLAVPKLSNLIIRDSADMFRTPNAFAEPFNHEANNGDRSNTQYQNQPTPGITRQPSGRVDIGAPISQFDSTRDRYGFKKKSQHVPLATYETWNSEYSVYLARRRRKWITVMKDNGLDTEHPDRFPPKSNKIKRFVRKGIPPDWRGEAWFWYSGGPQLLAKHPGLYDELVQRAANGDISSTDEELIERDLHRTFPDNILFKPDPVVPPIQENGNATPRPATDTETPILKSLRRVLQATSIYNPKIGYCQSLNFLAGLLLLFMGEERAFWMLDIITKVYLPGTHEVNLEGANVDLGVLMICIRDSMPAIWAKIGGELDGSSGADERQVPMRLPPITLCCTAWFMSCFIGTLPIETTLRVWDTFFFEGSKTLFRVALAVFKVGEAEIRAVNDPMEVFQVVQTIPRRLVDASALMEACFRRRNGFGHLTQSTIDARRAERRRGYADERAIAAGERPSSKRSNLFSSIRGRK